MIKTDRSQTCWLQEEVSGNAELKEVSGNLAYNPF